VKPAKKTGRRYLAGSAITIEPPQDENRFCERLGCRKLKRPSKGTKPSRFCSDECANADRQQKVRDEKALARGKTGRRGSPATKEISGGNNAVATDELGGKNNQDGNALPFGDKNAATIALLDYRTPKEKLDKLFQK